MEANSGYHKEARHKALNGALKAWGRMGIGELIVLDSDFDDKLELDSGEDKKKA